MTSLALLVSPRSKSAYFNDTLTIAEAELGRLYPDTDIVQYRIGEMEFLELTLPEYDAQALARLSFVYGVFEKQGDQLLPLAVSADFQLHEDFVFGAKFKGKTNELLTQMLINVGLSYLDYQDVRNVKLLDPMCGRATTLLWALRYGMSAKGIEQDAKALDDVRQNVKKWCKVHRQKHSFKDGFVGGKATKGNKGKFIEFEAQDAAMRIITGNASECAVLLNNEKFDLIVSDLPYGVQHFTTAKTRNPLAVLKECAPGWRDSLKRHGVLVLAFNAYLPKRKEQIAVFEEAGSEAQPYTAAHRMSESIVRDVLVLKHKA